MAWTDLVEKLDDEIKTIFFSIGVLMPFWYLNLYLFNHDFFDKSDIILKIISCFCLSSGWYAVYYLINFTYYFTREVSNNFIFRMSGIMAVVNGMFLTTLSYYIKLNHPTLINSIDFIHFLKYFVGGGISPFLFAISGLITNIWPKIKFSKEEKYFCFGLLTSVIISVVIYCFNQKVEFLLAGIAITIYFILSLVKKYFNRDKENFI